LSNPSFLLPHLNKPALGSFPFRSWFKNKQLAAFADCAKEVDVISSTIDDFALVFAAAVAGSNVSAPIKAANMVMEGGGQESNGGELKATTKWG
jgi:hypothetical protein